MPLIPVTVVGRPTATVATTVAGLGAPVNGSVATVRAGSTPFHFIGLTYDSTYGKWVSDVFSMPLYGTSTQQTQTDVTAIAEITSNVYYQLHPYKIFYDAGLRLQVRHSLVQQSNVTGGTGKYSRTQVGVRAANSGFSGFDAVSFLSATEIEVAATTTSFRESSFTEYSSGTVRDFWSPALGAYREGGGTSIQLGVQYVTIFWRWVSA